MNLQGAPVALIEAIAALPAGEVCGRCAECPVGPDHRATPASFFCNELRIQTDAANPRCDLFVSRRRGAYGPARVCCGAAKRAPAETKKPRPRARQLLGGNAQNGHPESNRR